MGRLIAIVGSIMIPLLAGLLFQNNQEPFKIETLLPTHHPIRLNYIKYKNNYNIYINYLLVESRTSLYDSPHLIPLDLRVNEILSKVPGIDSVTSLTGSHQLSIENGRVKLLPFHSEGRLTSNAFKLLQQDPYWRNKLISQDGKVLIFSIWFTPDGVDGHMSPNGKKNLVSNLFSLKETLEAEFPQMKYHLFGQDLAGSYYLQEIMRAQNIIIPILVILMGVLFFFYYRSFWAVGLVYFVLLIAFSLMMTLIILVEKGVGPYSMYALFFIMVVSTADLIHFFTWLGKFPDGDLNQRLKLVKKQIWRPCLLTSITTSIGFLALVLNDASVISQFGWYCAVGSVLCFILTIWGIPHILLLFNLNLQVRLQNWQWALEKVIRLITLKPGFVVVLFIGITSFMAWSTAKLRVSDDMYNKFVTSHPLKVASNTMSQSFGFAGTLEISFPVTSDAILEKENYYLIERLEADIGKLDNVVSIKSVFQELSYLKNWTSQNLDLAILYELLNRYDFFKLFYAKDQREQRTIVQLKSYASDQLQRTLDQVEALLSQDIYQKVLRPKLEGVSTIMAKVVQSLLRNFLVSFLFSLGFIFILFWYVFRSLSLALLGMIPNFFPLILVAGLMGLFEIPVENNLVVLICIILGIAVDDTIHFILAVQKHMKSSSFRVNELSQIFNNTGRALILTTFTFIILLPCLLFTQLIIFQHISLFLMVALIGALAADLILLPALFKLMEGYKVRVI